MGWQDLPTAAAYRLFTAEPVGDISGHVFDPVYTKREVLDDINHPDYICKTNFIEPKPDRTSPNGRIKEKTSLK